MLEKVKGQNTQTRKASEAGPLACAAGQDYEITQMRKPRVAGKGEGPKYTNT